MSVYDDVAALQQDMTAAQADITALETAVTTAGTNITALQGDVTDLESSVEGVATWQTTVDTALADSGWIDVALASGWTNPYNADRAQYRKVGNRVYMRGLINATSAAGTLITTLPTGYRPNTYFSRYACSHSQSEFVNLNIKADGTVTDYTKGTNGREFISLYGISFFID